MCDTPQDSRGQLILFIHSLRCTALASVMFHTQLCQICQHTSCNATQLCICLAYL